VPAQIYNELVSKVRGTLSESSLVEVKGRALPLCWKGKKPFRSVNDVKNQFKALSLKITHAHGTSYLDIPPQNYLIVEDDGKTCLAIRDASSDPVLKELNFILIGGIYGAQIQKIVRALETSIPCLFIKDIYFDPLFCSCYDAGSVCDIQQREQAARMGSCAVRQGAGA
uniref:Uncharacterized protein n=1 Tax=Aegilops tauschii subsp. strangulata TaxID=200361 RepID=A0A453JAX7_AEGTS